MSDWSEAKVRPSLLLIQHDRPTRVFELTEERTLIGRNPDCDITLAVEAVSRRHARIVREANRFLVEDMESRNHTYLDGEELEPYRPRLLTDGSEIRICRFRLLFHEQMIRLEKDEPSVSTILGMIDAAPALERVVESRPEEKLRAILEIGRDLSDSIHLKDVFEKTLESLFKIFPQAERGFVLLRESPLETPALAGTLSPQAIRQRASNVANMVVSRTILERVMNDRKAILSVDTAKDEHFSQSPSIAEGAIRTMLCVPLFDRERIPVGVLQIDTENVSARFGQDDLDLLLAVAGQVGLAMDNIRLHEQASRRGRIEQGARDAWQVQKTLLPEHVPDAPGYRFWDCYEPAQFVGGDYFDYVRIDAGGSPSPWALAMADASGKGMSAALLMVKLATEFRLFAAREPDPLAMIRRLNQRLCDDGPRDRFVTFLAATLDVERHRLTLVNAGHMPPLIRRADGRVEELGRDEAGTPLAVDRDRDYQRVVVELNPGDVVVFYTDGVTDALNEQGEDFGGVRLREAIRTAEALVDETGQAVLRAVRRHAAGQTPHDDITLLCLGRVDPAFSRPAF